MEYTLFFMKSQKTTTPTTIPILSPTPIIRQKKLECTSQSQSHAHAQTDKLTYKHK